MPPSSPPPPPHYPPRAGRLWVGRRAKVAERTERTGHALAGVVRWFVVALIPGMPFGVRGKRALGLVVFGAWAVVMTCFLISHQAGDRTTLRFWIPLFGTVQFEPVYLWYGLAAGVHIASVAEHLRPLLQARLQHLDLRSRFILTLAATLAIAAFLYYGIYATLL